MQKIRGHIPNNKKIFASQRYLNSFKSFNYTTQSTIHTQQKNIESLQAYFEQQKKELAIARDIFYETYYVLQESKKEYDPQLGTLALSSGCSASGIASLILLDGGALNLGLGAGFAIFSLSCIIGSIIHALKQRYTFYIPYKRAWENYQKIFVNYTKSAYLLNKPTEYSLDDINLNKYQLVRIVKKTLICTHCNSLEDLCSCIHNPKKMIEKKNIFYQLIKKEQCFK